MYVIRFSTRHLSAEDLLRYGMRPFSEMKRRNTWPGAWAQKEVGLGAASIFCARIGFLVIGVGFLLGGLISLSVDWRFRR
jgi:hypothetical protein